MQDHLLLDYTVAVKSLETFSEYLHDFLSELTGLLQIGSTANSIQFNVKIECFACDAPARAFVKNVKSHKGYHSCLKCEQERVYNNNRMTFPKMDSKLRTDGSRKMINK